MNKRRSGPFKETKITYVHKGLWHFNAVTQENKLLHVLSALNSTVLLKPKLYFMVFWRYLEFCESCQQSLFLSFSRFTLNIVSVKSHLLLCCGIDSSTHGTSRTEPRSYVLDQLISWSADQLLSVWIHHHWRKYKAFTLDLPTFICTLQ